MTSGPEPTIYTEKRVGANALAGAAAEAGDARSAIRNKAIRLRIREKLMAMSLAGEA